MAEQSNSGRQVLTIGVILGLIGIGAGAYSMVNGEVETVDTSVRSNSETGTSLTLSAEQLAERIQKDRKLQDVAPAGLTINGQPRYTPLFFAPELWQVRLQNGKAAMVDIYDVATPALHEGINNLWFISQGLSEDLGYSNAPELDSDGDGFSNREEFVGKTNPNDVAKYPSLLSTATPKLEVTGVSVAKAVVTLDSNFATAALPGEPAPTEVSVRIFASDRDISPKSRFSRKIGESFGITGIKGKGNKRFSIISFEQKRFESYGAEADEWTVKLQDNDRPIGATNLYTVRAGKPRKGGVDKGAPNQKGVYIEDTTVTLKVLAGSKMGSEIKVPYGATFKIPGDEAVSCVLESVDDNGSANVLESGKESPINIPAVSK